MKIKVLHEHKLLQIVDATQIEIDQLNISLEKQIEGWAFKKKFYSGWDGKVKFIKGNLIPFGLWKEVYDICQRFKFELEIENLSSYFSGISLEDFQSWVTEQFEGNALQPRDYQVETAWKIIKYKSCLGELATSAGKTLITFMVFSYLIKVLKFEKILMIVPNVTLVEQADGDFYEYNDPKIIDYEIQLIYSGKKIKKSSNIVVGTYQSLVKKPKEFFAQFNAVCIDECLHPDTLITMSDGLEKKISEINSGDLVYTTNDRTLKQEIKEVDFVYTNLSKGNQMYEIEMENGSTIKITGNHKVKLISGEYKRADQLTEDDEILSLEDYFSENLTKNILEGHEGHPDSEKLLKNLKQFYEN